MVDNRTGAGFATVLPPSPKYLIFGSLEISGQGELVLLASRVLEPETSRVLEPETLLNVLLSSVQLLPPLSPLTFCQ